MSSPVPSLGSGDTVPEGRESTLPDRPGRHLPALDGVRAVAATAVLLTHVGFATGAVQPSVLGALTARLDIGVALFFALSGYLMLRPWIRVAIDDTGTLPSTARYALLRAGRILPAYWLVTAVVLVAEATRWFGPDLESSLRVDVREVVTHLFVAQGLTGDYFSSFSQTWSLTTEICFYLVVPVVGWLMVRRSRRTDDHDHRVRLLERGCLGVIALGVAVATFSASDLPGADPALATSVLGHAAWFAAGALVCVHGHRRGRRWTDGWSADQLLLLAAVVLVLAASPLGGNLLFEQPAPWQAGVRELLYTSVALLVVGAAATVHTEGSVALRLLSSRPLAWLGTRSYALFLWHLPILFALLTVLGLGLFEASFPLIAISVFVLSVGVADLSWRFVERPILDRVHRIGQARRSQ